MSAATEGPFGVVADERVTAASLRRDIGLVLWQVRYEQRSFWRNRQRGVLTFVFPIMFLVIFGATYQGQYIRAFGHVYSYDDFFVPGILAYGVISASYVNLGISTAILRDQGVLKRMQGTPLPAWAYIAARVGSSSLTVLLMTIITFAVGHFVYSVPIPTRALPAVIVTLICGTAALTTLGLGITRLIKNAEAAPVVINLSVLPLSFVSGIWFYDANLPKGLQDVANFFPLRPLANGLQTALYPFQTGAGFVWHDLRDLLIWAVVGALLMRRGLRVPEGDSR